MSLYGVMRTSTSGMNVQSSRISSVAENVANANTTGYKSVRTEFSSVFIEGSISSYNSGSVETNIRRLIGTQGTLVPTSSVTDLAILGDGFFVVQDVSGSNFMTRAGSFVPNGAGELINSGGFKLLGYPLGVSNSPAVVNGFSGLVPVTMNALALSAVPSSEASFSANLPYDAAVVAAADLPSANVATATFSAKSSLVAYGNLGEEVTIDIYYTKTGPNEWEAAVFDRAQAGPNGGFPYGAAPLSTSALTFDPANGKLLSSSAQSLSIPVPGSVTTTMDVSDLTQLAAGYTVIDADVNGNAAGSANIVEISENGVIYIAYDNGIRQAMFQIPVATVQSPDNLNSISGNVFSATSASGDIRIGFPLDPGFGKINSGVLEQSTADIASEFTDMIDAQRGYTANSKVFQTGAELLDVLVNLKR